MDTKRLNGAELVFESEAAKVKFSPILFTGKAFLLGKGEGNENNFVGHRHHFYRWAVNADRGVQTHFLIKRAPYRVPEFPLNCLNLCFDVRVNRARGGCYALQVTNLLPQDVSYSMHSRRRGKVSNLLCNQ